MEKTILPRWVLVNGQIHIVSDFAHLKPSSRPEAICPVCKNQVIMKLGKINVHHYAHKSDSDCTATQPETALHLNTKFYIYKQLLLGNKLDIKQECSNHCRSCRSATWVGGWEDVKIESDIGKIRPDIVIIENGEKKKAIEIKVTHAVEDEKKEFYKTNNINWLEIKAFESIYDGENAWKIDQPLEFSSCHPPIPEWTCDICQKVQISKIWEQLEKLRLTEDFANNYSMTTLGKIVDFYYPSGEKHRCFYYLSKVSSYDKLYRYLFGAGKKEVVNQQEGESCDAFLEFVFDSIDHDIENGFKNGAFSDEHSWSLITHGNNIGESEVPYLYEWNKNLNKWIKQNVINPNDMNIYEKQVGRCVFCGEMTNDWWCFDGATQTCKCNKCDLAGKH